MSQQPSAPATNRIGALVRELLDRGYEQATRTTLTALVQGVGSPRIQQRLAELEAEAARLAEAGERLKPDNAVLRALLADLEPELRRGAARVDAASADLQTEAVARAGQITRELALFGRGDRVLGAVGVAWNVPDPEAVQALVGYVSRSAWRTEIERFAGAVLDGVVNQAIRGIVEGWSPLRTARAIRALVPSMTLARAQNLMRTVQLTSYRDAAVLHRVANADILQEQIRIAVLDSRTCLACIALHGTRLPISERINDHHQGRCTSIAVVRGGLDRTIPSGEEWFSQQPEARQLEIAGAGAFEALRTGRARLRDFVQPYRDPVFGEMVREASLSRVLAKASDKTIFPAFADTDIRSLRTLPRGIEAQSERWLSSLSRTERDALKYWIDNANEFRALGRGADISPFATGWRLYDSFVSAWQRAPVFEGVSWRGVSLDGNADAVLANFQAQVGTSLRWDTWSSASADAKVGGSFTRGRGDVPVLFEVRSRQGRYINAASQRAGSSNDEYELIFPPDATFRIVRAFRGNYESPFGPRETIIVVLEDL